ncbi:MAG: hypothetical protein ACI8QT_001926 [Halioglobus sp.]|jgi:hypothetical protein
MSGIKKTEPHAISIVQRGNLKILEQALRKQWRLGQNIVLCWSADERGLLVLFVPHYFPGNYCAVEMKRASDGVGNEAFFRDLVSGGRRKNRKELFAIAARLDVSPTFIKLTTALAEEAAVLTEVEQLIKRYGISYVDSRAVLLFDISSFSLCTPFEQASQLNSLSYSMNSAYNKLLAHGIEINFARTTTGDGYYVWNRDIGPASDRDLFCFMLLIVADNAVARAASKGNTTPIIKTAYHIGSHYELYQAEGINPTIFSYIVGDVTIELARMIDLIDPLQLLIGDFQCEVLDESGKVETPATTQTFVAACDRGSDSLTGVQFSGKAISSVRCYLTSESGSDGKSVPRRLKITDKHGLSRQAYNLQFEIEMGDETLALGFSGEQLLGCSSHATPAGTAALELESRKPASAADLIGDLSKRSLKASVED